MRDLRTINCEAGQKAESDDFMKRLGDISYRNFGTVAKMGLFDSGKALIVGGGFKVEPSSGMTVNVPSGAVFQRFIDVVPCLQTSAQTITLDAATGVARTDIIEAQVKSVSDKTDYAQIATVASGGGSVSISNEEIKRDIKYYLSARKQTGTTSATSATAGTLTGTVVIAGTIDLSENYLLNLSDKEDGSFQEIDLRGATPEATTLAEINSAINAAVGRTMASVGGGNVAVLTGEGTGQGSFFTIKPPNTDADKDALEIVYGLSEGGVYRYEYEGTNEWFKLAEIDVGTATTTITASLIRNVDKKSTWTGEITDIIVHDSIYQPNLEEFNVYDSGKTYVQWDASWFDNDQYVSLQGSNLDKDPIMNPNYWEIVEDTNAVIKKFQRGKPIFGGFKNIDNVRDAGYEQWVFGGYHYKNGQTYKEYLVKVDGTTVTGDTDLETILDVGGANEYFNLDLIAPDTLGTRTLLDYRGRGEMAIDGAGGNRAAISEVQEDQFQGWQSGALDVTQKYGAAISNGNAPSSIPAANNSVPVYQTTKQSDSSMITATDDGTNGTPRTGLETYGKNFSTGVPYVTVLLPV